MDRIAVTERFMGENLRLDLRTWRDWGVNRRQK